MNSLLVGFSVPMYTPRAEDGIDRLDAAAVPGDLDGMADGALHLARRRGELLADDGIQPLRHIVDDVRILDGHLDALAQIRIPLDVGRDADGDEDVADALVQRVGAAAFEALAPDGQRFPRDLRRPVGHDGRIDGLHEIVSGPERNGTVDDLIVRKVAHDDERTLPLAPLGLLHHREPIEPLQKEAQDHDVGIFALQKSDALFAAPRHAADFIAFAREDTFLQFLCKCFVAFQDQNPLRFHIPLPK